MAMKKKKAARQSSTRAASPKRASLTRKKVTPARKKATPARQAKKKPQGTRTARVSNATGKSIDALNERLDMMLPEVMFRIAALEHLLVKNQLCSYEELVNARQFIQDQEGT